MIMEVFTAIKMGDAGLAGHWAAATTEFPGLLVAAATSSVAGDSAEKVVGFGLVDWVIVVLYALLTLYLGWFFGRKQVSTKEYFTGSGNMNPLLIGVSLFASLLSTITYLSTPGEMFGKGPGILFQYLAYPVIFLIVGFVLLPVYMRLRVTSAYEMLEDRLGVSVRLLGATMFLLLRLVWMALLITVAAEAFCAIIGADDKWVPWVVIVAGSISLIYASLGGLRAVVVTDLMQSILLYGGAAFVIAVVSWNMRGFDWFPTEWNGNWDRQTVWPETPATRITVLGTFLSTIIWYVATSAGDQVSVQRFMSTRNLRAARIAIGVQLCVGMVVGITLGLAGFAMLGYFQAHPELLPDGISMKENADKIFPYFIGHHLPNVISGLVAAGLFAAAMSSMDSGINSITAVVNTDFVERLGSGKRNERQQVVLARWLALIIGVIVVLLSAPITLIEGNITAVTQKTVNLLTVPIFCLFLFALFFKRASPAGVWIGWFCGTAVALLIAFSGPIFGFVETVNGKVDPISFQWISVLSLVVNVVAGMVFSLLLPGKKALQSKTSK